MMSSTCSIPMLRRIIPGVTPAFCCSCGDIWRCVVEAGWHASDLASPRLTSRLINLEGIIETSACVEATANTKGQQGAGTTAKIFLCEHMVGIVGEIPRS